MKVCLRTHMVSDNPLERIDYCQQLAITTVQESAKSIATAVERGWPTVADARVSQAVRRRRDRDHRPGAGAGAGPLVGRGDRRRAGGFEVFARHLDAAGAVGIPCVTLHPPLDDAHTPADLAEQFALNCRFYERAVERARVAGTKLATHSPWPPAKGLWGAKEYDSLFDAVPAPENGMIFCFGCMAMTGYDVREVLTRFVDRTFMVHVRDVVIHADGQVDEVFPGTGQVRPDTAIALLHQLGYRGAMARNISPGSLANRKRDLDGLGGWLLPRCPRHPHIVPSLLVSGQVAECPRRFGDAVARSGSPNWFPSGREGRRSCGPIAYRAGNSSPPCLPARSPYSLQPVRPTISPSFCPRKRPRQPPRRAPPRAVPPRRGRQQPVPPPQYRRMCPRYREHQTLIVSVSDSINQMTDTDIMNPFLLSAQRTGWHFSYEPLYYYDSVWNDKVSAPPGLTGKNGEIPYQAESYSYNPEYTELTVKLRPNVTWSDGKPFATDDVVFTINMLKDNAPKLNFSTNINFWVKEIVAVDKQTVKFTLTQPNPQFMFQFFQWYQDQGFPDRAEAHLRREGRARLHPQGHRPGLADHHWALEAGLRRPHSEDLGPPRYLVGGHDRLPQDACDEARDRSAALRGRETDAIALRRRG